MKHVLLVGLLLPSLTLAGCTSGAQDTDDSMTETGRESSDASGEDWVRIDGVAFEASTGFDDSMEFVLPEDIEELRIRVGFSESTYAGITISGFGPVCDQELARATSLMVNPTDSSMFDSYCPAELATITGTVSVDAGVAKGGIEIYGR